MLYKFNFYPQWRSQLIEQKSSFAGKTKTFEKVFTGDSENLTWQDCEKDLKDAYFRSDIYPVSDVIFGYSEKFKGDHYYHPRKDEYSLIMLNHNFKRREEINCCSKEEQIKDESDLFLSVVTNHKGFDDYDLKNLWRYVAMKKEFKFFSLNLLGNIKEDEKKRLLSKLGKRSSFEFYHGLFTEYKNLRIYETVPDLIQDVFFTEEQQKEILFHAFKKSHLSSYGSYNAYLVVDPADLSKSHTEQDSTIHYNWLNDATYQAINNL